MSDVLSLFSNATGPALDVATDIDTPATVAAALARPTPKAAIDAWVAGRFPRYVADPIVPAVVGRPDGTRVPVLGFVIDGVLYVHPDREPLVKAAIARVAP